MKRNTAGPQARAGFGRRRDGRCVAGTEQPADEGDDHGLRPPGTGGGAARSRGTVRIEAAILR